jgi:exocyst complex component 4
MSSPLACLLLTHHSGFDAIVTSYQELSTKVLLTLHMEIRCQILHALSHTLSSEHTPYILDQEVKDPDPQVLTLNTDLIAYDSTISSLLLTKETSFIRTGLSSLTTSYLITNAPKLSPINKNGYTRMKLNIRVLQQNLKNIEDGESLERALRYYSLFEGGAQSVVEEAKMAKENKEGRGFNIEELKAMMALCYSEQVAVEAKERGNSTNAQKKLNEDLLKLDEYMWES